LRAAPDFIFPYCIAGCDAYLAKPFRRLELNAAIEDLLKAAIDALLLKSGPGAATAGP
jgi:DNA-binding response OmpR family regulator